MKKALLIVLSGIGISNCGKVGSDRNAKLPVTPVENQVSFKGELKTQICTNEVMQDGSNRLLLHFSKEVPEEAEKRGQLMAVSAILPKAPHDGDQIEIDYDTSSTVSIIDLKNPDEPTLLWTTEIEFNGASNKCILSLEQAKERGEGILMAIYLKGSVRCESDHRVNDPFGLEKYDEQFEFECQGLQTKEAP